MNTERATIDGTDNKSVINGAKARNNGRYNGNGREWETPPEVFGPLDAEFDFTLDPCCTVKSAKCLRYYTEAENGLVQDWGRERVFMNPPYGREVYAWARKAREAAQRGALVVGLLPASTDLAWWHEDVVASGAEVRYIRGRVRFLTDGPYRASGFFPSVVVVWPTPAPLQALIEEWRGAIEGSKQLADVNPGTTLAYDIGIRLHALRTCADELEAVLPRQTGVKQ